MSFDGTDTLKLYLDDIRRTKPIPRDDEAALFRLCREGNAQARERIVQANMRFVLKVALQYRNSPLPITDLVNEGSMGLLRAIESYDPSMGLKFISYAVWWIKAFIVRAIDENGNLIRIPSNQHLRIRKALREHGDGDRLDEDVRRMLKMGESGVGLDSTAPGDDRTYAEKLADDSTPAPDVRADTMRREKILRDLIKTLPELEATVVQNIYGIDRDQPMTLREVSEMLEISHERIRQIRDKAIRHLRMHNVRVHLREQLEACQD